MSARSLNVENELDYRLPLPFDGPGRVPGLMIPPARSEIASLELDPGSQRGR